LYKEQHVRRGKVLYLHTLLYQTHSHLHTNNCSLVLGKDNINRKWWQGP